MDSKRYFRPGWVWLFPTAYLIHLLDERFYWIGTARFATEYLGIYFTDAAWLWVNLLSTSLPTLSVEFQRRCGTARYSPAWHPDFSCAHPSV